MFQAGGLVVVLVEVNRKPYLASLVPVIVNAILNEHQIIVDIVAFVNRGDFPRSRLGEKQRGKILAGWVTRKMRTLAQWAIRDVDPAAMGEGADAPGNRASTGSARSLSAAAGASSLRNVAHAPQILEQEEFEQQMDHIANMAPAAGPMDPADDPTTPTAYPAEEAKGLEPSASNPAARLSYMNNDGGHGYDIPDFERFGEGDEAPPAVGPKPQFSTGDGPSTPQIRLPGVDGREPLEMWAGDNKDDDDWSADLTMRMNLAGGTK